MSEAHLGNDFLQCPYNKSHRIRRKRFQVHLIRCRKSYPLAEKVTCPFNVTHCLNKEELDWHVTICPERRNFEDFRHTSPVTGLSSSIDSTPSGSHSKENVQVTENNDGECREPSDNWDDQCGTSSYNPSNYTERAEILRKPVGMTPSERNAFREAERKRLQSLKK